MEKIFAKVVSGNYQGREGIADTNYLEKTGNVMFYPEGGSPYRVCLPFSDIEKILDE